MSEQKARGERQGQNQNAAESCGCGTGVSRREFVTLIAAAAAVTVSGMAGNAVAGPFELADFDKLVPVDKKLSAEWIRSLFDRGNPHVYRGDELKFIGMPVGGIGAGQLYLGGDGRLCHWDVFNQKLSTGADHYAHPVEQQSSVAQGFTLRFRNGKTPPVRTLDAVGFPGVTFTGQYPIGAVEYRDAKCPLAVTLEAFSPFIPLNVADSSLPATILHFTIKNTTDQLVLGELVGHLQNAVALQSALGLNGKRINRITRGEHGLVLHCSAGEDPPAGNPPREPIIFEDFEGKDYGKWIVEGEAFGKGPARGAPGSEQHLSGYTGKSLANSWTGSDAPRGKLTSPEFTIERIWINFLIGGGNHPKQTCINLLLDGKIVRTTTGKDTDSMEWAWWDVRELAGKTARIEIVDDAGGGWGHIDVDQIEFADAPRASKPLSEQPDFGTMTFSLLNPADDDWAVPGVDIDGAGNLWEDAQRDAAPFAEKYIGAVVRKFSLQPGESQQASFVLTWYFPNLELHGVKGGAGRHYATRFKSATDVAYYIAANFERLSSQTRLWRDTWYDSTLPHWFLDRTFLNASILATSTSYLLANGRFYGWEGVGCCEGTCTHVWHYGQAMGRLFPELEIRLRERADFDPRIGMNPDGMIDHRGEFHAGQAVDGQAGIILRAYRDHQMSVDDAFLKRNYVSIKNAMQWLVAQDSLDGIADGILQGAQHNTLDAEWYGPVAWLSGLYLASLRAAEEMAREIGDKEFAGKCREIFDTGRKKLVAALFEGEYFINRPDPKRPDAINSGTGCEIDQVFGQSWAFQVGLGRVLPEKETRAALASLWRYNFTPDAGAYRKVNKDGRWYAMAGEAGLLMCTFPRSDWSYEKARGKGPAWATGYFNECMNGFEHQVAGHMIWEGMVQEGLAVERAIHDRYDAIRRNPWNEVECGDHYARSMASYGVFLAACGFACHGPSGYLAIAPRLTPENFKAAFTSAAGWGTLAQQIDKASQTAQVTIKLGQLKLQTLSLTRPEGHATTAVSAALNGKNLDLKYTQDGSQLTITFSPGATISPDSPLEVRIDNG